MFSDYCFVIEFDMTIELPVKKKAVIQYSIQKKEPQMKTTMKRTTRMKRTQHKINPCLTYNKKRTSMLNFWMAFHFADECFDTHQKFLELMVKVTIQVAGKVVPVLI